MFSYEQTYDAGPLLAMLVMLCCLQLCDVQLSWSIQQPKKIWKLDRSNSDKDCQEIGGLIDRKLTVNCCQFVIYLAVHIDHSTFKQFSANTNFLSSVRIAALSYMMRAN